MKLAGKGWSERTRAGLERLIESGAGKGHAAVFDFDNTIVCGDIGEATFALLAKEKLIKKDDIMKSSSARRRIRPVTLRRSRTATCGPWRPCEASRSPR